MIEEILSGATGGIIYSLSGWKSTEDSFDFKKLGKSILISGIVGAICAITGQQFDEAIIGTLGIGITALVNKGLKILNKIGR